MTTRLLTGTAGLDQMLHGGLPTHSVTLISGPPGIGKTTLGIQFIYTGITQFNQPGLILTFEEEPHEIIRNAATLGFDLAPLIAAQQLEIVLTQLTITDPTTDQPTLAIHHTLRPVLDRRRAAGVQRVLIDSLSHIERLNAPPRETRIAQLTLFQMLKRIQMTSLVLYEADSLWYVGAAENTALLQAMYAADTVITMRYKTTFIPTEPGQGPTERVDRELFVLKMRGSDHDKLMRKFTISTRGIQVS